MNGPSAPHGVPAGAIQLSVRPGVRLRPGDVVQLTVIKELSVGKWAVGIQGRVYPAFSRLALQPGSVLRATVASPGGRLILVLNDQSRDVLPSALARLGVAGGADAQTAARALMLSGLPLRADMIEKVRAQLSRIKTPPHRAARLIAALLDKGIDPSSRGIDALLGMLSFGERGGADHRRYKGRRMPATARDVAEYAGGLTPSSPVAPDALQAFNHIRGASQTWIVVPFAFDSGEHRLAGTIKILYDPFLSRPLRLSLSVSGISFHLPVEGKKKKLSIFCDDEQLARAARQGLDNLRAKFHNMGIEVDDTILGGDAFDGFSPTAEGSTLPIIDVAG